MFPSHFKSKFPIAFSAPMSTNINAHKVCDKMNNATCVTRYAAINPLSCLIKKYHKFTTVAIDCTRKQRHVNKTTAPENADFKTNSHSFVSSMDEHGHTVEQYALDSHDVPKYTKNTLNNSETLSESQC